MSAWYRNPQDTHFSLFATAALQGDSRRYYCTRVSTLSSAGPAPLRGRAAYWRSRPRRSGCRGADPVPVFGSFVLHCFTLPGLGSQCSQDAAVLFWRPGWVWHRKGGVQGQSAKCTHSSATHNPASPHPRSPLLTKSSRVLPEGVPSEHSLAAVPRGAEVGFRLQGISEEDFSSSAVETLLDMVHSGNEGTCEGRVARAFRGSASR